MSRAMHIATVARTLIGANQRTMRCRALVVSEQTMPKITSVSRATSTVCNGVLYHISIVSYLDLEVTHGEYA